MTTSTRKTLGHLLPRGHLWNLYLERGYTRLVDGVVPSLDAARDNADSVFTDLLPQETTQLDAWERQWNLRQTTALTTQERRDRLDATWAASGGQSPSYITNTLQAAGFPVYVHEWWDLAAHGYPAAKDPRDYLLPVHGGTDSAGILIGNLVRRSQPIDEIGCGEAFAECGEAKAECGYFGAELLEYIDAVYVGPETTHGYYLYIGGQTFPDTVNIDAARQDEFETLCRQICPAQQWLVLRVVYV